MAHQRDKWLTAIAATFVCATISACNRGDDKDADPKVVELPVPVAPTGTAQQAQPREVKRYGAEEQPLSGSVRVTADSAKAYFEANDKGEPAQELAKSTLVNRKASFGEYSLVEYPTPRGDTDLGWVLTKDLASGPEALAVTKKQVTDAGATAEKAGDQKPAEAKAAGDDSKTASAGEKQQDTAKDTSTKTTESNKTTDAAKKTAEATKTATDAAKTAADATKTAADSVAKSTKSAKLPSKKP